MKRLTLFVGVFIGSSILLVAFYMPRLLERMGLERNNEVELAIDMRGQKLSGSQGYTALCDLKNIAGSSGEKILYIQEGEKVPANYSGKVYYQNNKAAPEDVQKGNVVCFNELEKPDSVTAFFPEKILTLHILKPGERQKLTDEQIVARFKRAVVERHIKILVVPDKDMFRKLALDLVNSNIDTRIFIDNPIVMSDHISKTRLLLQKGYALMVAIIFPLLGFFLMRSFNSPVSKFAFITLCSLLAGLIIAGAMSETEFILKLMQFSGIKLALLFPPLFVFFVLAYENRELFKGRTVGILAMLLLSVVVIGVIARSGNYSMPLLPFEKELREWFEKVFIARPRLKEFMIGHPAMLLGLYIYGITKNKVEKVIAVFLLALGMLGQTSMINTFCHPHADLILAVLRTLFGLAIGVSLGVILILCHRLVRR